MSAKLVELVRLNGGRGAGCHDRFCSRGRPAVKCFMLTAPFIELTLRQVRIVEANRPMDGKRF
jgi:hypothetical protein